MKKSLSLILALILIFSSLAVVSSAASMCSCGNTPVVYVKGYRHPQMKNEDGTMTALLEDDTDVVGDLVSALIPLVPKALLTDNWDEYCSTAYEMLAPLYKDAQPRPDGSVKENTGICDNFEDTEFWSWNESSINANAHKNSRHEYYYIFDFRLSMLENAKDLNDFIQAVKAKTGHDKVILVGRCGATGLLAAWLYKFGEKNNYVDLEKFIAISSDVNGADFMEALLSGTIKLESDAVYRYIKNEGMLDDMITDPGLNAFVTATIDALQNSGLGIDAICSLAEHLYSKVKDKFFARLLKEYYGITPAFVSYVYDHYEEYKDYIFQQEGDKEKYAAIIADADEYHYEAQLKFADRLKTMDDLGINVHLIAFYGDQTYPFTESALLTSDEVASVKDQSIGAVAAPLNGTLSEKYIQKRIDEGNGKYISIDKQIGASSCLLPQTTWFVKNAHHSFDGALSDFVNKLERNDITVDSDPNLPQFLNHNGSSYVPLQETNGTDTDWSKFDEDAKEGSGKFFDIVFSFFNNFINKIKDFILGIVKAANGKVNQI